MIPIILGFVNQVIMQEVLEYFALILSHSYLTVNPKNNQLQKLFRNILKNLYYLGI